MKSAGIMLKNKVFVTFPFFFVVELQNFLNTPHIYSVKKKSPPPKISWHFLPNGWEFLVQILHAYTRSYLR